VTPTTGRGRSRGERACGDYGRSHPTDRQRQDLGRLLRQQAVHRRPAGLAVEQLPTRPTGVPAVRAALGQLQHLAGPAQRPAAVQGLLEQVQQAGLGDRVDSARDPATQPQRPFPSTRVSLTSISLSASDSRATRPWTPRVRSPARGLHARFGRRQRCQSAFLGHRPDPQDRRAVDLLRRRGLGDRHLPAHQLQPYLVLLRRRHEPLAAPAGAVAPSLLFGHDQILREWSENP
jgi:hypothetical protein